MCGKMVLICPLAERMGVAVSELRRALRLRQVVAGQDDAWRTGALPRV